MNRTFSRSLAVLSLLVFSVTAGGCWGRNFWRAQQATLDTEQKVDSLLRENAMLQRRVYQMEKTLGEQQDIARRATARTSTDMDEIKDQLNALMVALETSRPPASGTSVRYPSAGEASREREDVPPDTPEQGGTTLPDSSVATRAVPPPPGEMYRQIYLDFSRMDYEIALEESAVFLEEYPGDRLVEDVRFIRGESYSELGRHFDALKEFSKLLQDFPRGEKVPSALLRMAISYDKIGETDLAAGVVGRLVREYPASEEAAEAQRRFGDLLDER